MYIIIDGSSMLSTNYYGTLPREMLFARTLEEKEKLYPKIMQTSTGKYTNGVYTSVKQILKMIEQKNPEGIVVVLDKSRNTFRRDLYAEYKAQRPATPSPLKEQFITFGEVLSEMGIPVYTSDKYEADDLAGAIAKKLEAAGKKCVLISGDKDYYQLVSNNIDFWRLMPSTAKKKYEKVYNVDMAEYAAKHNIPTGFFEIKMGDGLLVDDSIVNLTPEQFVDYLAVVGDKADNIPGVNRVGPATIVPLLQKYNTLDTIYSIIHDAANTNSTDALFASWKSELGIKTNPINLLLKDESNAYLSRKLAKIETNISEVPCDISKYMLNLNRTGLNNVIESYEFTTLKQFV